MASRELLHVSQMPLFSKWLESQGWSVKKTKGALEALRAVKPGRDTLIICTRSGTKEHFTVPDKWVPLVRQFISHEKGETRQVYTVMIEQTLVGFVAIEAADEDEALEIADERYREQGEELPDMDDSRELAFCIAK